MPRRTLLPRPRRSLRSQSREESRQRQQIPMPPMSAFPLQSRGNVCRYRIRRRNMLKAFSRVTLTGLSTLRSDRP